MFSLADQPADACLQNIMGSAQSAMARCIVLLQISQPPLGDLRRNNE
jgi:hypothetical protein